MISYRTLKEAARLYNIDASDHYIASFVKHKLLPSHNIFKDFDFDEHSSIQSNILPLALALAKYKPYYEALQYATSQGKLTIEELGRQLLQNNISYANIRDYLVQTKTLKEADLSDAGLFYTWQKLDNGNIKITIERCNGSQCSYVNNVTINLAKLNYPSAIFSTRHYVGVNTHDRLVMESHNNDNQSNYYLHRIGIDSPEWKRLHTRVTNRLQNAPSDMAINMLLGLATYDHKRTIYINRIADIDFTSISDHKDVYNLVDKHYKNQNANVALNRASADMLLAFPLSEFQGQDLINWINAASCAKWTESSNSADYSSDSIAYTWDLIVNSTYQGKQISQQDYDEFNFMLANGYNKNIKWYADIIYNEARNDKSSLSNLSFNEQKKYWQWAQSIVQAKSVLAHFYTGPGSLIEWAKEFDYDVVKMMTDIEQGAKNGDYTKLLDYVAMTKFNATLQDIDAQSIKADFGELISDSEAQALVNLAKQGHLRRLHNGYKHFYLWCNGNNSHQYNLSNRDILYNIITTKGKKTWQLSSSFEASDFKDNVGEYNFETLREDTWDKLSEKWWDYNLEASYPKSFISSDGSIFKFEDYHKYLVSLSGYKQEPTKLITDRVSKNSAKYEVIFKRFNLNPAIDSHMRFAILLEQLSIEPQHLNNNLDSFEQWMKAHHGEMWLKQILSVIDNCNKYYNLKQGFLKYYGKQSDTTLLFDVQKLYKDINTSITRYDGDKTLINDLITRFQTLQMPVMSSGPSLYSHKSLTHVHDELVNISNLLKALISFRPNSTQFLYKSECDSVAKNIQVDKLTNEQVQEYNRIRLINDPVLHGHKLNSFIAKHSLANKPVSNYDVISTHPPTSKLLAYYYQQPLANTELIAHRNRLIEEGRIQAHCVASYDDAIQRGGTVILNWSDKTLFPKERHGVTVELKYENKQWHVEQIKGKYNANYIQHKDYIDSWLQGLSKQKQNTLKI